MRLGSQIFRRNMRLGISTRATGAGPRAKASFERQGSRYIPEKCSHVIWV